ncbi:MAG: class II aldolase/adducin family protein [Spirochaetia bacterium]|nr:class II aldolase/adducin family protein [Spirochaetia bacterium]
MESPVAPAFDEGLVKYQASHENAPPVTEPNLADLPAMHAACREKNWLGVYANGISFGNLSVRRNGRIFCTGTGTGALKKIDLSHLAEVLSFDLKQNRLASRGPIQATSEAMTHAAIYEASPETRAVVHIHSPEFWANALHHIPTTKAEVPYGTPEMAAEIFRLFREAGLAEKKCLAMAGHQDGLIFFGDSLTSAYALAESLSHTFSSKSTP